MSMSGNTTTTSNQRNTAETPDGHQIGGVATTSKVGFFGATPVVQPTSANQAALTALTDGSGGTAAYTNGIQPLTATYNSTLLSNSIATLAKGYTDTRTLLNQLRSDLVSLGIIKGS